MKMNTDSNVYTIVYSIVLVVIVAVLLAVVNQGLKARQEANKLLDTQKQMLVALNQDIDNCDDPAALYDSLVKDTVMCGESPVIVFEVEGQTKYMLRLHGQGLWGGIGGYMALNDDRNTVFGINFNHESETPGLGGEIVTEKFRSQFFNKHIKDAEGNLRSIAVLKEGKLAPEGQEQVDAWAGATITSTGVSDMLAANMEEYRAFLMEKTEQCCAQADKKCCTGQACCTADGGCKDGQCCDQCSCAKDGQCCANCSCQDCQCQTKCKED